MSVTSVAPAAARDDQRWSNAVTSILRNEGEASRPAAASARHGESADSTSSDADAPATSSTFARNVGADVSSEIRAGSRSVSVRPRLWIPGVPGARATGTETDADCVGSVVATLTVAPAGNETPGLDDDTRSCVPASRASPRFFSVSVRRPVSPASRRPSRSHGAAESSSDNGDDPEVPAHVEALDDARVRRREAVRRGDGPRSRAPLRERAHEERVVLAVGQERGREERVARLEERRVHGRELERRHEVGPHPVAGLVERQARVVQERRVALPEHRRPDLAGVVHLGVVGSVPHGGVEKVGVDGGSGRERRRRSRCARTSGGPSSGPWNTGNAGSRSTSPGSGRPPRPSRRSRSRRWDRSRRSARSPAGRRRPAGP